MQENNILLRFFSWLAFLIVAPPDGEDPEEAKRKLRRNILGYLYELPPTDEEVLLRAEERLRRDTQLKREFEKNLRDFEALIKRETLRHQQMVEEYKNGSAKLAELSSDPISYAKVKAEVNGVALRANTLGKTLDEYRKRFQRNAAGFNSFCNNIERLRCDIELIKNHITARAMEESFEASPTEVQDLRERLEAEAAARAEIESITDLEAYFDKLALSTPVAQTEKLPSSFELALENSSAQQFNETPEIDIESELGLPSTRETSEKDSFKFPNF